MEMNSDGIDSFLWSCETIDVQSDKWKASLSKSIYICVVFDGEAELVLLHII